MDNRLDGLGALLFRAIFGQGETSPSSDDLLHPPQRVGGREHDHRNRSEVTSSLSQRLLPVPPPSSLNVVRFPPKAPACFNLLLKR